MWSKKIVLGVLVLLAVVPAVILNTPIGYTPLLFLALSALISILYTLLQPWACRVTASSAPRSAYPRQSAVSYEVSVVNRSVLVLPHISVTLRAENTQGLPPVSVEYILMLGPRENKSLELPMQFPHLGLYRVSISRLRFYGFFGVFSLSVRPRWRQSVQITPREYHIADMSLDTLHPAFAADSSSPCKMDGGEYADVRPYVPGDPMKNIHWKLSAHTRDYMTRVLQTDSVSGLSVCMDLRAAPDQSAQQAADLYDCTVESAYAAALCAIQGGYAVELVCAQANTPRLERPADRQGLFHAVCRLPFARSGTGLAPETLLAYYIEQPTALDNLLVLTGAVTEQLIRVLTVCVQRGRRPVLCRIRAQEEEDAQDETLRQRLASRGIRFYSIHTAGQFACLLEEKP
jgi:uncharacterized protein (DUF58 family)